jgi:hypothetical protein
MLVHMTAKRRMTMADIKRAAEIGGSPYFERGSVRFFGGDKNAGPYVGPGGIYFAQSNRAGHKVKHVTLEPWSIHTAEDATSHVNARERAKALARSSPSQAARAVHARKKTPAQLQREIDEALANPAVKCPSPEHPLYPELRHIRQVAHDTSWGASQLAKDAEAAFRNGDCVKAAVMLEAAKRAIAKERRKRR